MEITLVVTKCRYVTTCVLDDWQRSSKNRFLPFTSTIGEFLQHTPRLHEKHVQKTRVKDRIHYWSASTTWWTTKKAKRSDGKPNAAWSNHHKISSVFTAVIRKYSPYKRSGMALGKASRWNQSTAR